MGRNVTPKSSDLRVQYRTPLVFSFVVWLLGWVVLWDILPNNGILPKNSPGVWFDICFWICVLGVNGLLGPVMALKYSLRLEMAGGELNVKKYFGLLRTRYVLNDIAKFDLIDNIARMPVAKISFVNGDKVYVSGYASRFAELCSIISAGLDERSTSSLRP